MKRVLIVDDSPSVLAQLSDALADEFDVVTALSGEEAIEILEDPLRDGLCFSNTFDLIITDLVMPGMNGFEFSEYVRKRNRVNRYTPVIMLTSEKITKEDARRHGCAAYISKADKQRVLAMVRILMQC